MNNYFYYAECYTKNGKSPYYGTLKGDDSIKVFSDLVEGLRKRCGDDMFVVKKFNLV